MNDQEKFRVLSMEAQRRWNIPMLRNGIYVWRLCNTGNGIKDPDLACMVGLIWIESAPRPSYDAYIGSCVRPFEYKDLLCFDSCFEVTKNKSIPLIDMWGDTTTPRLRLLIFIWHTKPKSYGTVRV